MLQVLPFFIILRPRPRTYVSTSPLLLQLHQQQQLLSINIINSTNHHLQHAKLRIQLQQLTSHAAYERSGGPPKRLAAKRPCMRLWPSVDISKVRRKQSTRKVFDVEVLARRVHAHIGTKRTLPVTRSVDATYSKWWTAIDSSLSRLF